MTNDRDDPSFCLLTALVAIVCIASVGQAVGSEAAPTARADVTRSARADEHRVKRHDAQTRDAS